MACQWLWQLITAIVLPLLAAFFFLTSTVEHINVDEVLAEALRITSRSWELGTLAEALLELRNPELSVFSNHPFLDGKIPCGAINNGVSALEFARPYVLTNNADSLVDGEGSPADPASLGVSALLLSCTDTDYLDAASRQARHLVETATRFQLNETHSAISHRDEPPELWGDFIYMVPPFLAYYGAAVADVAYIEEAVKQCELYNDVLETVIDLPDLSSCPGLWRHIVSQPPELPPDICCTDPYVWLTSNAWAIAGMTRVLGVVKKWDPPEYSKISQKAYVTSNLNAQATLVNLLSRMMRCLQAQSREPNTALLKNYQDGSSSPSADWAYGDAAGTALVTSAIYRLTVLVPAHFKSTHLIEWADENYRAVAKHIDSSGKVSPVASVHGVPSKYPADQTSEGQSMVLLMYAARRDCVKARICSQASNGLLRYLH